MKHITGFSERAEGRLDLNLTELTEQFVRWVMKETYWRDIRRILYRNSLQSKQRDGTDAVRLITPHV